jgi:hypothetical protein
MEATWKRMEKGSTTLPGSVAATRKVLTKHAFARPKRRCEFAAEKVLTRPTAEDYIPPYGRAAAWRDGASAKPLTDHSVKSIRPALGYAGCIGFGGSGLGYDTTAGEGSRKGPMLFDK